MLIPDFLVCEGDTPAKRAVIGSALGQFVRKGIDATTIRNIAEESGFTNPALFRHFASKDALALYIFESCYRRIYSTIAGQNAQGLDKIILSYLELIDEAPEAVLFVLENIRRLWPNVSVDLKKQTLLRYMELVVRNGQDAGTIRPELDPTLAAGAIIGILAQTCRMLYFGELNRPAVASHREISDLVARMLL